MTSVHLICLLTCLFLVSPIHGHANNKNEDFEAKLEAVLDFPSFLSHSQVKISRSRLTSVEDEEQSDTRTPSTSAFIHGNDRTQARVQDQQPLPSFLSEDETVLTSDSFSPDERLRPTIGNGHVATVIKNDAIFMNGLYNGYNVTSHRARIPSLQVSSVQFSCRVLLGNDACATAQTTYSLDVGRGFFKETHKGNNFVITLTSYAHRMIPQLLVQELEIVNTLSWPLEVMTFTNSGNASEDIHFYKSTDGTAQVQIGITREAEYTVTGRQSVTVVSSVIHKTINVGPNLRQTHLFLISVDKDYRIAKQAFKQGVSAFMAQTLQSSHTQAWLDVWRNGRLSMEGNKTLAQITYAALYYIISALPLQETKGFVGLSPGDLAHGSLNKDYQGHVFWDQETWMYPPILMLHDKMGKALINTRIRVLDTAKQYAASRGYQGAMFPWESAMSGLNVCPWDPATLYEQHVTGDVALAMRQYLMMTNDTQILSSGRGIEAVTEIADFWASRVQQKPGTQLYEILDVMPPDEWHQKVNNSAYTNAIARLSLLLPKYAYGLIGRTPDKRYENIGQKMYMPFDQQEQYHPEFEGYTKNTTVKQADVVLLGYPLMEKMDLQVRRNDLEQYKKVTPGGPAMTWGMFSIGYLELNATQTAADMFLKQLGNVVPPFNIWTENIKQQGAVNFITGMGGYLQSLIFGYGGLRTFPTHLEFLGTTPPGIQRFNITGIDYLRGSLDFSFSSKLLYITLTKPASKSLQVQLYESRINTTLVVGQQLFFANQKGAVVPL